MTFKDDLRNKTGAFLSKSQEIFENIFSQATRELSISRKVKPAAQKPLPPPTPGKLQRKEEKPKVDKRPEKTVSPPKPPDKVRATTPVKTRPTPVARTGKRSPVLSVSLLIVLLLVIAGFLANYFAIIDLTVIPDFLGLGPKQVVQAPIPRKQPVKPPERPVTSPKQPQTQEKVSEPTPSVVSKEEKLPAIETPATIAQPKADKERIEEKTPSASGQGQPKPPEVAVKQEPQPAPVQAQASTKPGATGVSPPQPPRTPQYPYSVYLGSYKAPEVLSRALSEYQEKGLSVYWSKVDLGDKGVWFRFFAGHFRTKEEAEKFIRDRNIQGAEAGVTKYANLIGIYGADEEVAVQKQSLLSAGFYPYVIKGDDGKSLLYSGAFDRKEYAEKQRSALASKGIRNEVVER